MGTITRKLKRSIVMLLVCALVAGSVPMNTYAAEIGSETTAAETTATDEIVVDDAAAEISEDDSSITEVLDEADEGGQPQSSGDEPVTIVDSIKTASNNDGSSSDNNGSSSDNNGSSSDNNGSSSDNDSPSDNSPSDNSPSDNSPSDNSPSDNSPSDNSPSDNSPSDNSPSDNSPSDNSPSDNEPAYVPYTVTLSSNNPELIKVDWEDGVNMVNGVVNTVSDSDLTFTVTLSDVAEDYHEIGDVSYTISGNRMGTIEPDGEGIYKIPKDKITGTVVICVEVVKLKAGYEKTVVFVNTAKNVKLKKVDTDHGVEKVKDKKNTYSVSADAQYVEFEVETPVNNYDAVVTLGDVSDNQIIPFEKTIDGVVTYQIAASELADTQVIRLSEKLAEKKVELYYDDSEVELVSVVTNGEVVKNLLTETGLDEEEMPTVSGNIPYGTKLTITVEAEKNSKLTSLKTTGLKKNINNTKEADTYTFTVEVKETDVRVDIDSEKLVALKLEENGKDLTAEKNVYTISNYLGNDYIVKVVYGPDEDPVAISDNGIEIKNGKNTAVTEAKAVSGNDNAYYISFNHAEVEKGKTLTLNVNTASGNASVSLKVLPKVTGVTVKGVGDVLKQTAYTEKGYAITVKPKTAMDTLEVSVSDNNVWADIKEGKLLIRTYGDVSGNAAEVKLYDTATNATLKTINVKVTEPKLTTVTPTAKLQGATNASLTLTLGAKGIEENIENAYTQYVVTADPVKKQVETVSGSSININSVTRTFQYEGASQTVILSKDDLGFAEGQVKEAVEYKIDVKLEQGDIVKNEVENKTEYVKTFESKEKTITASTKAPAYETNLKLKKGTTTVYQGQEDIVVATPVFSKATTYRDLRFTVTDADDLQAYGINTEYNEKDGKILVNVNNNIEPGKYVIRAWTFVHDTDMYNSSTSVTITVKPAANSIYFDTPDTIYKAENKPASFKVGYTTYNNDGPIKSKVKLSIVDVEDGEYEDGKYADDGNVHETLKKYVSIKNGKVNIAKNYIQDENNASFRIKAEVTNYKGKGGTFVDYSDRIEITNRKQELGDVVIVNSSGEVVAESGDEVSIDEVQNAFIRVLNPDAVEKDSYSDDDFISANDITITANKKDLILYDEYSDGIYKGFYIGGIKRDITGLKITAALKDGSGQKAELTELSITGVKEELALEVLDEDENVVKTTVDGNGNYTGTFSGPQRILLYVNVVTAQGDRAGGKGADYKVSFENANTVYSAPTEWGSYWIEPKNDKPIEITLQDKVNNKTTKYILTNTSLENAKVTLRGVKVVDAFTRYAVEDSVTVTLPKGYEGKYVALYPDLVKLEKDDKYKEFVDSLDKSPVGIFKVEDNAIEVEGDFSEFNNTGSYKMYLSVGSIDVDNNFVAETKETAVTFKVVKRAAAKLATSYTINLKDGNSVALKTTTRNASVENFEYWYLYNDNIKGTPNKFKDNFRLEGTSLVYQGGADIASIDKDNLTGWVQYFDHNGIYNYVQIKVKLENASASKYAVTNATVVSGNDATVTVTKDKKPFAILAAYSDACEVITDGGDIGNITIPKKDFIVGQTKTIDVYVVGNDTCEQWTKEITTKKAAADAANAADKATLTKELNDLIKEYGVKVTTKVTVITDDKAKDSKTNKIKLASNKVKLTADDYISNSDNEVYETKIDFNEQVTGVNTVSVNHSFDSEYVEVKLNQTEKNISIKVNKAGLSNTAPLKYGKEITVEVTFNFNNESKETEKIKVTLPEEVGSVYTYETALREAIDKISRKDFNADEYKTNVMGAVDEVLPKDVERSVSFNIAEPEAGKEGKVEITINSGVEDAEEDIVIEYTLDEKTKIGDIAEVNGELIDLISEVKKSEWPHDTTLEDMAEYFRTELELSQYSNIRLEVREYYYRASTTDETGRLCFYLVVVDFVNSLRYGENYVLLYLSKLPKLVDFEVVGENATVTVGETTVSANSEPVEVKELTGGTLVFTVSANEGYELKDVTVSAKDVSGNNVDVEVTPNDNEYTVTYTKDIAKITVTVTTNKLVGNEPYEGYSVSVNTVSDSDLSGNSVSVNWLTGCVDGKTVEGEDISFTLILAEGDSVSNYTVTYTVNGGSETTLPPDGSNNYVIPEENITGPIVITITKTTTTS